MTITFTHLILSAAAVLIYHFVRSRQQGSASKPPAGLWAQSAASALRRLADQLHPPPAQTPEEKPQ